MEWKDYCEAAEYLKERIGCCPAVGIVLGSGLDLPAPPENEVVIPYGEVPHMPVSTAPGHAGYFSAGLIKGIPVICMHGRMHPYEGYPMQKVAFPIRVMKLLGVQTLILTNVSGAMNEDYRPGEWMLIRDHINFLGDNPLVGPNEDRFGPRFHDMTAVYSEALRARVRRAAEESGIPLHEGVYFAVKGPSYETPAEIRAYRTLGGDAVGMSTVPEAITAAHCGMQVLGLSLVSNMAAGITGAPLSEQEVLEAGRDKGGQLERLILSAIL